MTEGLKIAPCPFCGGEAKLISGTSSTVQCQNDQCIIGDPAPFNDFSHRHDAIAAWNRRASSTPMPGREEIARVLAKADGADWDETCGLEIPDGDDCDSSTCVAAGYEDHDPDWARTRYLHHADAVRALFNPALNKAGEQGSNATEHSVSRDEVVEALLERAHRFVSQVQSFDWNEDRSVMVAVHLAEDLRKALTSLRQSPNTSREGVKCAARSGNIGPNYPQDCDWPVCGCDPHADKVIAALEEAGKLK